MSGATDNLTPAAARVLDTASELFYNQGIRAIGVDAIAEAAGVTKKTLYDRFGSKDELVAVYLRRRDERWRAFLTDFVDRSGTDPFDRVLAVFTALGVWMKQENPRGCGFVNAFVELTDPQHPGRIVATEQKRWLVRYLTRLVADCGIEPPRAVADQLLILHEGATVTNSMHSATRSAAKAREAARCLLTAATA